MSLSLVQDYSSAEEEEAPVDETDDSGGEQEDHTPAKPPANAVFAYLSKNSQTSSLPSPDDLFSEITGPPEFLKSGSTDGHVQSRRRNARKRSPGKPYQVVERRQTPPPGAVFASKAKLIESRERVQGGTSDDVDGIRAATAEEITTVQIPEGDAGKEGDKRNRLKVKDKERSKRMKGQSSHATWKSETEMHLRQQFD